MLLKMIRTIGVEDVAFLIGAGCIAHGVSIVSVPAAWIVSGCMIVAVSVMAARAKGE